MPLTPSADGGLRITEIRGFQLAQIGAFRGAESALNDVVRVVCGAELPREFGRVGCAGATRLYRLTPAQYWWVTAQRDAFDALEARLPSAVGSAVSLSASRRRFRIEGARARDFLAHGIALDLAPASFEIGRFALTGLHHTGVLLERVGAECYEIFAQRTYAVSIQEWLLDAAKPFGGAHIEITGE